MKVDQQVTRMSASNPNEQKLQAAYSRLIDKLDHTFAAFERLNDDLAEISELVCGKLLEELRSGSISAYSASCAQANIVNATGKLNKQVIDIITAIRDAGAAAFPEAPARETEDQKKLRQVAEKALALMARQQAERVMSTNS
jgi:hypothetical protein